MNKEKIMKSLHPSFIISAVFLMSTACPLSFAGEKAENCEALLSAPPSASAQEAQTRTTSSWLPFSSLIRSITATVTESLSNSFLTPSVDESLLTKSMDICAKNKDLSHFLLGHHDAFTKDDINIILYKGYSALKEIANGRDATENNVWIFKKNGGRFTGLLPYGILGHVILYGENQDIEAAQKKIETFICIVWALCDHSFKNGKGFHRGSFSIIDTDGYFEKYLKDYMIFVGEATDQKLAGLSDLSDITSAAKVAGINNQVYRRISSHFPNRELFYAEAHYGCDARLLNAAYALHVLPFSYTHVLLAFVGNKLNKKKIFLKPEEYGIADLLSLTQHGRCYANSGNAADRDHPLMAREKYIPDDIAQATYELLDVAASMCYKEDINANNQEQEDEGEENTNDVSDSSDSSTPFQEVYFLKCIESFHKEKKTVQFYNNSNNVDISMLWEWSQWTEYEDNIQAKLDALKAAIIKNYGNDDNQLRHRTGHEVVLNISDFKGIIVDMETFFIKEEELNAIDTSSTPYDSDEDWDEGTILA